MSSRRFVIDPEALFGDSAELTGPEAHHLRTVLRLAAGAQIDLLDGIGGRYLARIERITRDRISLSILERSKDPLPKVRLQLGQALLPKARMDLVLQKATELGVDDIHPFTSEHGIRPANRGSQLERWRRILLESCKQCNRACFPKIHPPDTLRHLFDQAAESDLKIIFWEEENTRDVNDLDSALKTASSVFFLLGPVGGFSPNEIDSAKGHGFIPLSLGSRILRAETATIVATAIIQHCIGNLRPRSNRGA